MLNNGIKPSRQESHKTHKTAYKLNKENIKISWECKANEIYNKIRGLSPYPGARTTIINLSTVITSLEILSFQKTSLK